MKKSELKDYIKEEIKSILQEADKTAFINGKATEYTDEKELMAFRDNPDVKSIKTAAGKKIKEEEEEPSSSELKATMGLAKAKEELAALVKDMKSLAQKYKNAEGKEKDDLLKDLKDKTNRKKELNKILDKV